MWAEPIVYCKQKIERNCTDLVNVILAKSSCVETLLAHCVLDPQVHTMFIYGNVFIVSLKSAAAVFH